MLVEYTLSVRTRILYYYDVILTRPFDCRPRGSIDLSFGLPPLRPSQRLWYSITETTGDLFALSPDLQAIAAVESQGSFPLFGADAHHLNVELSLAYDFSVATSLQSPEPAGETGVNYLITGQFF